MFWIERTQPTYRQTPPTARYRAELSHSSLKLFTEQRLPLERERAGSGRSRNISPVCCWYIGSKQNCVLQAIDRPQQTQVDRQTDRHRDEHWTILLSAPNTTAQNYNQSKIHVHSHEFLQLSSLLIFLFFSPLSLTLVGRLLVIVNKQSVCLNRPLRNGDSSPAYSQLLNCYYFDSFHPASIFINQWLRVVNLCKSRMCFVAEIFWCS